MSDIKITIGAEIKELEQKLTIAKSKLSALGETAKQATVPVSQLGSRLTSLASSLVTGGVATGIAIVTGALILMVKKMFEASAASKRLAEEQVAIGKAFKEAADNVGEEISKVTVLTGVLESENTSRLQKIEALKQLKKINYDYFGQLDIEDGKVKGLGLAYDGYVAKLIRSISAKANIELLTEALKKQAQAVATINENQAKGFEKFTANNLTQYQIMRAMQKFNLDFGTKKGESVFLDLDKLQLIADLLNAEEKVKAITSNIRETIQDVFNGKEVKIKEIKIKPEKFKLEKDPRTYEFLTKLLTVDGLVFQPQVIVKPKFKFLESANFTQEMTDAALATTAAVQNIYTDAFIGMGDAIGNAIMGKGNLFAGVFSAMFRALGAGVRQIGVYAIMTSKAILAIKASIGTTLGIVGGIALVALGSLISAAASKIAAPKFASGVRNFQGGFATVGERGPERVFLPTGSSVQPNNEVNAYGGGQMVFIPAVTLQGTDLVIAFNRASQQMGRNN